MHLDKIRGPGLGLRPLRNSANIRGAHNHIALGWHYLSNATCLMQASFVVGAIYSVSVEDQHKLHTYSPLLKKTCVRQVVLDKWFPLKHI